MNQAEKRVLAALFSILDDNLSAASCNDFDLSEVMPDVKQRRKMMRRVLELDGCPEDFDERGSYETVMDWQVLSYFADKLGLDREVTE